MKITVDTNILVRAATQDDPVQGALAQRLMQEADLVAIALPSLCEFCWVLLRLYKFPGSRVADALRVLIEAENVRLDRQAVEAGLAILDAGGDFADGVIAHEGQWLGGETFMSFDQKAIRLLQARGEAAEIPA
ncbi:MULTISPECIES: type II toxin-antitoxin system VapC family toxin [Novosphingobium]|uniref:Putative nucleic-acid-binding protein, contains PIN domain n=1 Tax=Novosphingobium resinovorum TaxID=158500 RepID=A0A031JDL1_9SPHN|nr:type II toxin-antitoxin system VapC family toxin [Novosphingobium resinovorum]EZP72184.1 putative nucleic-acid-binding protein, contains PIN domain [Novosphingobium resinovorum]GLK43987.1 DNA-binding protein [Novosphingobium resinovorum]